MSDFRFVKTMDGDPIGCSRCSSEVPTARFENKSLCEVCANMFTGDVYIAAAQAANIIRKDLEAFKDAEIILEDQQ